MFFKNDAFTQAIEKEQLELISKLEDKEPDTAEYAKITEQLKVLNDLKTKKSHFTKDGVLGAVTSLAGILLVLNYERIGAVTSKSFGLIRKP